MKQLYLASALSLMALIAGPVCDSAYAVTFTPPANSGAPSRATGGASRGNFFTPPANGNTPKRTTGGASRGNLFTPTTGSGVPQRTRGGASRGDLFKPANGKGTARRASGGASRVGTYYLNPSIVGAEGPAALIALLPQTFHGTTVSERPTILVYIPASNAEEAVFSLKDEAGNMQYQMTVPVAGKTGVVPIKLPTDAPALAIGKNYQWFLALKVDGQLSPSTPYVDGWVQRIQPNTELTTAMQQGDALELATAFGKNGVWYDCVATMATLHASQPSDITLSKQWTELLSSVGLKEITTAPVLASAK